ncbi:uncharacterized protein THITE_2120440 [Thermothielavioides terrestris NRRL 8126]|uniref:Clr5 domain-containing protein n=1 Tax=Thermothielavioides terrestris (strain ATCC 38088 / NRRL 8126) TaxID=578455 RepID=G2RAP8_THETT|nr:uncharacterized protein THITE_2120440 [Thermothielavioides terrestris NRRL 8126]AEO69729.1 hypothetical protein THITE_2120440 [Thermothielavioides terrestris NRRL 8126]
MPASSDIPLDWEGHRRKIEDLYWNQAKELPEVMQIMKDVYGFVATKKMYKKHLKAWGLEKNLKTAESIAMLKIAERRRAANKDTRFTCRGRPVEPGKLRRFAKRHNLVVDGAANALSDQKVSTPPSITYTTPEPDPSNNSLPPAPLPYPESDTSEADQVEPEDPAGSSAFDNGKAPQVRSTSWVAPEAIAWPLNSAYREPPGPPHQDLGASFISTAFSGYQGGEMLRHVPRSSNDMGSVFSPPTWPPLPNIPGHGYRVADGIPSYIFVAPPPQQHTLPALNDSGFDHSVPGFTNNCSPTSDSAMLGVSNSFVHSMNSAHAIAAALPDASNSALEHTPLHDAVVANRVDLVKDLLERGANPNCAARGGMSPLHYAAYQRNVELVALLLKFGANLDAMTDKKRSILFFAVRGRGHESNDDMLAYASQNSVGNSSHTDEATIRVLRALFDSPSGWIRLRRCLDKADKDGVTPLMVAAEQGFEDTVRLLLRRGAQPDVKNHAGHTALKYAASSNHRMLVRLLLEADPGILDRDLSHLLKLASRNFTARAATDHVHEKDGQDAWCDDYHKFTSRLIAEEMVQLCRERGLLDGLLTLAAQRRKANVLELLLGAMTKLGIGRPGARLLSGC